MELSQEEKDRIVAEEKLRMETRKEFFKESFGHGGPWRGGWRGYGCHRGGGLKVLAVALIIFAACHFWHNSCSAPYYGYAIPTYQVPAPVAQPADKK